MADKRHSAINPTAIDATGAKVTIAHSSEPAHFPTHVLIMTSVPNSSSLPGHADIAIVGGGPVGMLLALNLHRQGKKILLIEARKPLQPVRDARTLALSWHSLSCLERAGIRLDPEQISPIVRVNISQQRPFAVTELRADDLGLPMLGAAVDYTVLVAACEEALRRENVPVAWETPVASVAATARFGVVNTQSGARISASWVVLAEGGHLAAALPGIRVHTFDYRQSAVVATLNFSQPEPGVAWERFSSVGPMALLPYHGQYRLIWTRTPEAAKALQHAAAPDFTRAFESAFGFHMGQLKEVGTAAVFPLVLKQLNRVYSRRVICVGNAAQTMHPVAAQGFNLGVRDAATLSQMFETSGSLNDNTLGEHYAAARRVDAHAIVGFTHSLVTLFDNPHPLLARGRRQVMTALQHIPALRRQFSRHLIYGLPGGF